MSTVEPRRAAPASRPAATERENGHIDWAARTRIFLTPVAAPSILGLFGFASSTFMVAAYLAGWCGQSQSTAGVLSNLAPFTLFFGGLAQFLAGMWSYRARDAIGTAMHGMWGAFWMAFGVFFILVGTHALPLVTTSLGRQFVPFSYWFYTLAVLTGCGFIAALFKNAGLSAVLFLLAAGSACVAIGFSSGITTWYRVGGYILIGSAGFAVYTAFALMLQEAVGRVVLPLGLYPYNRKDHWKPGVELARPQAYEQGMPGSKIGQ